MAYDPDIVARHAQTYGLDPQLLHRIIKIESSGNPLATTGSYHGLMQMSPGEFARWGGQGSIYNADANVRAGAAKLASEMADFQAKYGRPPTATEAYLQHQQGVGGLASHMANPDQPAWQSMYSTGEGREKGPDWARRAIWGNVPKDVRSQYPGGVENLTSRQFMDIWRNKVEGGTGQGEQPTYPVTPVGSQDAQVAQAAAPAATTQPAAPAAGGSAPGILGGSVAGSGSAAEPPAASGGQPQAAAALASALGELSAPKPFQPIPQLQPLAPMQPPLGWQIARRAALRGAFGGAA